MKKNSKQFSLTSAKMPSGSSLTPEQLSAINRWTLKTFTEDELYARPIFLCHNAIDRDRERFSEPLLADFVNSLPGKSLLLGHKHGEPGAGLFFSAEIVTMTLSEYELLTGESVALPDSVDNLQVVKAWFYIANTEDNSKLLSDIDAGIARHVSIGFQATDLLPVKADGVNSATLYWEYLSPGEATEGSLVWLGAQTGATVQSKSADPSTGEKSPSVTDKKNEEKILKEKKMRTVLKAFALALGLSADAEEGDITKSIRTQTERLKFLETAVIPLGDEVSAEKIKQLATEASDGRSFKKSLIERQIKTERLAKKLGDAPDVVDAREKQLATHSIAELQADVAFGEARFKHLSDSQFEDKPDGNENRGDLQTNTTGGKSPKFADPGTEVETNG